MKFRNFKLGTKQFIGFACVLAMMVGVNIYTQQTIRDLKNELDEVTNNWLQRMSALSGINLHTTNLRLFFAILEVGKIAKLLPCSMARLCTCLPFVVRNCRRWLISISRGL